MKIIFSDHARKQNVERKIPRKLILETIKHPEKVVESFRNRKLHQRRFDGKILEVVVTQENQTITVVTQYWLERE